MVTEKVQVKWEVNWKVILLIILAAVIGWQLTADVPKVEKAIESIGAVTLASEEVILQAEQAYAALEPKKQEKVENYDVLLAARAEYECLVTEEAIDQIGAVNLDSEAAIVHAEELYGALSQSQQQTVDNRKTMTDARKAYDEMVSRLQAAMDAIDAIGNVVNLNSGDRIKAAREACDALAALEKSSGAQLMSALGDRRMALVNAEAAYEECVVADLYEKAEAAYGEKNYEQALEAFRDLAEQYPDSKKAGQAKDQAFACSLKLAEDAHNKGDQYAAMKHLKDADQSYASSEEYKTLMDKIVKRLTGSRPSNGAKMSDQIAWGWCELRVTAEDQDICVKIVSKDTKKVTMFYVRSRETASAKLENGSYHVYYTTGTYWFDKTHGFGDEAEYGKAAKGLSLNSWIEGNMVYYYRYDLDFGNSYNNDITTTNATAAEFWG